MDVAQVLITWVLYFLVTRRGTSHMEEIWRYAGLNKTGVRIMKEKGHLELGPNCQTCGRNCCGPWNHKEEKTLGAAVVIKDLIPSQGPK